MITRHTELDVYKKAFAAATRVFDVSKRFPKEETYSLTDQLRRASRSGCANMAETWRKRRYEAHCVSKLSDCESEAAEVQVWLQFAVECEYLEANTARPLFLEYDVIIAMLVNMIRNPDPWVLKKAE